MIKFLSLSLFPLLVILAATSDVLTRRIPNSLILAGVACFLTLAGLAGMPAAQIALHLCSAAGALILGYVVFSLGWLGGGDAKLLSVVVLWLGPTGAVPFVVLTAIAGGFLSLAVMFWAAVNMDAEMRGSKLFSLVGWIKPKVPYGYAIAIGALMAFPASWWGQLFTP